MTRPGRRPEISVAAAQESLSAVIDQVRNSHEPVCLTHEVRRLAVIIGVEELDHILPLAEDMEDVRAAENARAEMRQSGKASVPWDDLKAELGLA